MQVIVDVSTRLDAPIERVWDEVQTSRLLVHVTSPLVRFTPLEPNAFPERWSEGRYQVRMKLLGVLPAGSQVIAISKAQTNEGGQRCFVLRDNGSGDLAKTWDHVISLRELPDGATWYQDRIEVKAGLLTPFVWLFAQAFYRHRQRRWRRLVARGFNYDR
jgi:ligand-binding SRPBCC domain-containing protein